jgi:hypothetical protein
MGPAGGGCESGIVCFEGYVGDEGLYTVRNLR